MSRTFSFASGSVFLYNSLMDFNHAAYKESLLKILDMGREGHLLLLNRMTMIVDVAKTYLWTASVILGVSLFLIKDAGVSPASGAALGIALFLDAAAFLLALYVLWGKGVNVSHLYRPHDLAAQSHDICATDPHADTNVIVVLINGLNECNITNQARKKKLVKILRIAAPCLFCSFVFILAAALLRLWHV